MHQDTVAAFFNARAHCSGIPHARAVHYTQMAKPDVKKMQITWVRLSDTSACGTILGVISNKLGNNTGR
jgi:hypothetical protein